MEAQIILGRILQKFIDNGFSKYLDYNRFGFIELKNSSVIVSREAGDNTPDPFKDMIIAIKGYQNNISLYDEGPSSIRTLGITHITSPIHSLLHLLPKEVYQ